MIFCSWVMIGVLSKRRGRALRTLTTPRPASAFRLSYDATVELSHNGSCTLTDGASGMGRMLSGVMVIVFSAPAGASVGVVVLPDIA